MSEAGDAIIGVPEDFLLKGLVLCWPAASGPGDKQDPSGDGT